MKKRFLISFYTFCNASEASILLKGFVEAPEVHEVHVHVIGHVGVGELLSVGVVPAVNKLFFHKFRCK